MTKSINSIIDIVSDCWYKLLTALNHAFGGVGLWLILDELGIIQAIKFYFLGIGGQK